MKRINNLFETVTRYETLIRSFRLARRGCAGSRAVARFFYHLEPEILRLQSELGQGIYSPGGYSFFSLFDPKPRTIAVAPFRDRVVHHAVVGVLTPVYERSFIFDSHASRKGKGAHAAVRRAQGFLRRWPWYLKADIEKYFDSVVHGILMGLVERKIKDKRLLDLLDRIVRNAPVPGKGLPIGNLTSQFLANVYLDPLDHEIKDRMRIKGYLRYMDDFVLFSRSREELVETKERIADYLADRLGLRFHARATIINRSVHGLGFLGMRIFPGHIRVKPENRRRSLRRMNRRLHQWRRGRISDEQMAQSLVSITEHVRHFRPDDRRPYVSTSTALHRFSLETEGQNCV